MELSAACTMPPHAALDERDADHPRYGEYLRYRAAMTAQLVYCPSFTDWLRHAEESEARERANRHPRIGEYRAWLREYVHCTPPRADYQDFWSWLWVDQQ